MQVISSMFFSAASFYLLSLLAIILSNLVDGKGLWGGESSMIMVPSLIGLMIIFGWIPAAFVGIVSGAIFNASWDWTSRSTRNIFLTAAFIALGFVAFVVAMMFREALETPEYEGIRWASLLPALVISVVIFAANAISISLTKWFRRAPSHP